MEQTTPTPTLPHAALVIKNSRRRRGRIACLPEDMRALVNESLDNGHSYPQIANDLRARGYADVSEFSVGKWARGGYRDYLREKQRTLILREQTNKIVNVAASLDENGRSGFEKVSSSLIAARVLECLQNFDPQRLDTLLDSKPENFFRLAKTVNDQSLDLSRLRKVELDFQKYRDHVAEQKAKMEAALKPQTAEGLTKEQIAEIHEAMRLL
jgi:hypothetical protein